MAFTQVSSGMISGVANTAITGLIPSSQLASTGVGAGNYGNSSSVATVNINAQGQIISAATVTISLANTQLTGLITSGQIASVANTQVTGVLTASQGGTGNGNLTFPTTTSSIGYLNIPQNSQSTAYTTVASDAGCAIIHPASDANARTFTIAANSSVAYALGTVIQFINMTSQSVTIAINSDTLTWAQGGGTGSRTLGQYGVANAIKVAPNQWLITGTNLT
jgi:hypothetical protein